MGEERTHDRRFNGRSAVQFRSCEGGGIGQPTLLRFGLTWRKASRLAPWRGSRLQIALVLTMLASPVAADAPVQRGQALAQELCASCHATGRDDASPHMGAPPFRDIDRTLDLDSLPQRLERGLAGTHPDMPEFRFTEEDARAFRDYLRAIQQ